MNSGSLFPSEGGGRGGSLLKLIQQGEHQTQDFKYCISDSRKIARSLVAFANTDGGRLLIRKDDQNRLANKIMIEVWKREKSPEGILSVIRKPRNACSITSKQTKKYRSANLPAWPI